MSNRDPSNPKGLSESDQLFEEIFRGALSKGQKKERATTVVTKTGPKKPQGVAEKTRARIKKPNEAPSPKKKDLPLAAQGAEPKKVIPRKPRPRRLIKILIPVLLFAVAAATALFVMQGMKSPDLLTSGEKPSSVRLEMPPDPPPQITEHAPVPLTPAAEGEGETTPWEKDVSSLDTTIEIETVKEEVISKGEEAAETSVDLKEIEERSYPYSIFLGSFRREDVLQRALEIYRQKGLKPYPVRIDLGPKGVWFRVFAGHFETREEANSFIKKNQIADGAPRNTRYAVLIGTYPSRQEAEAQVRALQEKGFHPYIIEESPSRLRIYTGAYYRDEDAKIELAWLASKGVAGKIVER